MEKEEYKKIPEFVCVIDRSRSMYGKEKEIIESFNAWLARQKRNKKELLVTLALCNEECELLYSRMPVIYGLYRPGRRSTGTALRLDAIRRRKSEGSEPVSAHRRAG